MLSLQFLLALAAGGAVTMFGVLAVKHGVPAAFGKIKALLAKRAEKLKAKAEAKAAAIVAGGAAGGTPGPAGPGLLARLAARIAPFYDPTAWVLIALCVGVVLLFDPVMAKTLVEWVFFFGALCGFAIIISRHTFPQVSLSDHVKAALGGNVGAGLVVLGLFVFMSFLVLSLTLWGKA